VKEENYFPRYRPGGGGVEKAEGKSFALRKRARSISVSQVERGKKKKDQYMALWGAEKKAIKLFPSKPEEGKITVSYVQYLTVVC